ncbi:MAG: hypothetical protein IKM69_03810 [Alistipes sp.]|nr:hypothetical protein [Alistipes sp.]
MKKIFIVAMALAAFVSCSKDDGVKQLQSSKKAVAITIANGSTETRAAVVTTPVAADKIAGGTATIQDQAVDGAPCADVNELVVLFANANGTVEEAYTFPQGQAVGEDGKYTYRWHNVSESVTQVAVVRDINENGVANVNTEDYKGKNISEYKAKAEDVDAMENIDITKIDLYVSSTLEPNGNCTITDTHTNTEWTYKLYTADVTIAPAIARVEITGIACDVETCSATDHATAHVSHVLGGTTLAAANGQLVSGGYDELALGELTWGDNDEYKFNLTGNTLKGIYKGNKAEDYKTARTPVWYTPTEVVAEGETADGTADAIVWNINPSAKVPQIGDDPMVIKMEASAYDYTVVNTSKTLSIGFKNVTEFAPGNIYRFNINFGENNLDESNEAICVEVKVTIQPWVVVTVQPEFGNN